MKQLLFILIVVLAFGCENRNPSYFFKKAYDADTTGNEREAIRLYKKVLIIDPAYRLAYVNQALDYERLGLIDSAIIIYQSLLKQDPSNTLAFYSIGDCYRKKNDIVSAINSFNYALSTKGGGPVFLEPVQNDFLNNGDEVYFNVSAAEIYYERGLAYYDLDSLQKASYDLYYSLQSGYHIPDCHFLIAMCFFRSGNKENACEHFNQAVRYGDKEAMEYWYKYCR